MNKIFLNLVKKINKYLESKIIDRPNLKKAIKNISWLLIDKFIRMGAGLIIVIWIARYLGPSEFGLMNYSMAYVALFASIASFGLNSVVVSDLIKRPDNSNAILGTSFAIQLAAGFIACILSYAIFLELQPNDKSANLIILILSLTLLLKSSDVIKYWFESRVESRYSVIIENISFIIFSIIKIIFILLKFDLIFFIWLILFEILLNYIGLISIYKYCGGNIKKWIIDISIAKDLVKKSWPLILSSMAIMLYMRIDQIMLGYMKGDASVGIYSAAVRVSEVWYFIPIAIIASVFPSIISIKDKNIDAYHNKLQKLLDLLIIVSIVVAILATFLSNFIVKMLFGAEYMEAGPILAIHIWTGIFVSLGLASGNMLVVDGHSKEVFYRTALGAITNIAGNLVLIPYFGVVGAAIATVISQFVACFSIFFRNKTKIYAVMMWKSLLIGNSIIRLTK